MIQKITGYVLLLAVVAGAVFLRFTHLQQRPMHCDEAVHAEKFGELLEQGEYRYDYYEYHGPTLNYFTLIPAWLRGEETYQALSETTMRMVPAFFGAVLVGLALLLRREFGWPVVVAAASLTAVSPAMVYYSRYYIQEMLLVCFSFAAIVCGVRYVGSRHVGWAIGLGIALGLMHATKETCVIAYGAMAGGLIGVLLWNRLGKNMGFSRLKKIPPSHIAAVVIGGGVAACAFFSSFGSNPVGIIDSFRTYITYLDRAGAGSIHIHPWYMYFQWLFWFRFADGPLWSEGFIALGALVGLIFAFRRKPDTDQHAHLWRFLAIYTLLMIIVYSAIPYKTPWCFLGFLHGLILLAAYGYVSLWRTVRQTPLRILMAVFFAAGAGHLGWQAWRAGLERQWDADPRNPYVYAHTGYDIYKISETVLEVASLAENRQQFAVQVFFPNNYWPLPWYLRHIERTGFARKVLMDSAPAPVILADPKLEPQVLRMMFENPPPGQKEIYMPMFDEYVEIRPGVPINGYVVKHLWDRWRENAHNVQEVINQESREH